MTQTTQKDINSTADLLSRLEPGFLPIEVFNQISRLVRLPIVLAIPLK